MNFRLLQFGFGVSLAVGLTLPVASAGHVQSYPAQKFAVSRPLRDLQPPADASEITAPPILNVHGVSTTNLLNFDGTGAASYLYPDSNGAPGPTQYMQWTNARYTVFSKTTGAIILHPTSAKALWANLGGQCATTNAGDGIINYDKAAQRWVVTHHTGGGVPYTQCVAVSTSSDPTGTYFLYAFSIAGSNYPDYPQLGIWPDAYYLTSNLLTYPGFNNVSGQVCALDRASMLLGNPATAQCFTTVTNTHYSVLQPADLDGSTPPPAGSPHYSIALDANSLALYKFHVDFVNPANSTFIGPINIPVSPFIQACNGGYCVPQQGTTQVLDGVGDRLLHRFAYRNYGDHESLVMTHSINSGTSVAVRWYEIRSPGTTPVVFQQQTYAPDSNFRWLGSIAMDKQQNIAVGYSVSSATSFPSIRYTGRLVTDPLNTMAAENTVISGTGAQTGSGNDWGNASSLSIDPFDDCTFWYTNEYLLTTGRVWHTRLVSFKFAGCQ